MCTIFLSAGQMNSSPEEISRVTSPKGIEILSHRISKESVGSGSPPGSVNSSCLNKDQWWPSAPESEHHCGMPVTHDIT